MELNKVGIAYSFTFRYIEKTFKDLKEDITKLSTIIKMSKSLKRVDIKEVYQLFFYRLFFIHIIFSNVLFELFFIKMFNSLNIKYNFFEFIKFIHIYNFIITLII